MRAILGLSLLGTVYPLKCEGVTSCISSNRQSPRLTKIGRRTLHRSNGTGVCDIADRQHANVLEEPEHTLLCELRPRPSERRAAAQLRSGPARFDAVTA